MNPQHHVRIAFRYSTLLLGVFAGIVTLTAGDRAAAPRDEPASSEREQDVPADGPAAYAAWRRLSLQDENGEIPEGALMKAKAHVDMMRAAAAAGDAGISRTTWTSIGPGNIGGRVRSIVIHPTNHDTMFVGAVGGGIWKTTDGGTSWRPVGDSMANMVVSAIVMRPGNPDEMYAATGDGYVTALRGAGIFKSVDGGITWMQLPLPESSLVSDFYHIRKLAISPDGGTLLVATWQGLYRSTNGGASFVRLRDRAWSDVDFHPTDSLRAVAWNSQNAIVLYTADGGASWSFGTGLPAGRVEFAYAPSNGNILYAGVNQDDGSLYRSDDGGATFTEIFDGAADVTINPYGGRGSYANLLWVSPTDENFLLWGGLDVFKSTNGGTVWSRVSQSQSHAYSGATSLHADNHIAVAHPAFNGTTNRIVFFGNDGGVYKADDIATAGGDAPPYTAGFTELNNGLVITQFHGGAGNAGTGRITGGTENHGTLLYDPAVANPSENWTRVVDGEGGFGAYDSSDPNYFYGEGPYLTIHRNSSGGADVSSFIYAGISDANNASTAEFIAPFIKDPHSDDRLLAGGLHLWRTNNAKADAPAWEDIKDIVVLSNPPGFPGPTPTKVTAITVAPSNPAVIYVGHASGDIFKTTNGTADAATVRASWTRVELGSLGGPRRRVTRITIDPSDPNTIYVTFGGFAGDNIYRTNDGGIGWSDITRSGGPTPLPDVPVRDLEVHPQNSNWLYVATEVGLFTSDDRGLTWNLPHDGPANVSVDELFFMDTTLVAVTHGRGLFISDTARPLTNDDSYATPFNTTLTVNAPGVLGNDSVVDGSMTATLETTVPSGTLTLNTDGGFTYAPATGFAGVVNFTYAATANGQTSAPATVTITVMQPPEPSSIDDAYTTAVNTPLIVPAPGVLSNDSDNDGGPITVVVNNSPSSGTLVLNTDGSFTFDPAREFTGAVQFVYRAVNRFGNSSLATVTITVFAPPVLRPPTALAASVFRNTVTLTWVAPQNSITPTGYVLEGGVLPGQALAEIPTGGTATIFTIELPTGAFYLRMYSVAGGMRSTASNEIRVFVNVPLPPSPPVGLLGLADGSNLTLAWRNTFNGGAPAEILLDVSGAAVLTVALPVTNTFSFAGVPPGTYTFSVRARNTTDVSASSNVVTLTFPGTCAVPNAPADFSATSAGNIVSLAWNPPASGAAPQSYAIIVTGPISGTFPSSGTSVSAPLPPGTYTFSVAAGTTCGSSAATPAQTIVIP